MAPEPSASDPLETLLAILDLERLDRDLFRGVTPQEGRVRVFGGQVVAQALVAACRTVEGRPAHSLHAYFLLPGDPSVPIIYEVERVRDGRSFTTRRVVARQKGEVIFVMSASFHAEEAGHDHAMAMPAAPDPDSLPGLADIDPAQLAGLPTSVRGFFSRRRAIELKPTDLSRYAVKGSGPDRFGVWFRASGRLPDDPLIHAAVLAYASDMTLLDVSLAPHGASVFDPGIQAASLDHALWLHRPFRVDDWLLYAQDTPSAGAGRGFARGLIHDRAGRLVASVAQEGLIRPRRAQG
jgi:acyl-CoA thioesterase-2